MLKLKRAKVRPNNGSVVVYYSYKGIMRLPTGVSISKKKSKDGKFSEWDYKDHMVKTTVENYDILKGQIERLKNRANAVLEEHHKNGDLLTAKQLETLLINEHQEKIQLRTSSFRNEYEDFYKRKKEYFIARNSLISLKDYTSFKNMIEDYEVAKEAEIKIKDLNKHFLHELLNWLKGKMPDHVGTHKMRTKGRLSDKTCKKRFDILLQFLNDLKDQKKLSDTDFVKKFIHREIKPISSDKVTLTVEEVHMLYDEDFKLQNLNNIRDLFVFASFTGLRYEDLRTFDPRFIISSEDKHGKIYKKKASKTKGSSGKSFEIPLCEIAIEILERHGGSLKPILVSNVEANRKIKELLQMTGRFEEYTEKVDKITGAYLKRYEAVTMHKARDTFISNLVNTTPLNELMKYTAHSKLSTLQGYIDRKRSVRMQYVNEAFNKRKTHEH